MVLIQLAPPVRARSASTHTPPYHKGIFGPAGQVVVKVRLPLAAIRLFGLVKQRGSSPAWAMVNSANAFVATIPIVFAMVGDPVGSGFVASLSRPGGNLSGFTKIENSLGGKWVELLKEIAPRVARVAIVFDPAMAPLLPIT